MRSALDEMRRKARECGAGLIIGVELSVLEATQAMVRFVATGTAVRRDTGGPLQATSLSQQDHWLLAEHGTEVLGLVTALAALAADADLTHLVLGGSDRDSDGGYEAHLYSQALARGYADVTASLRDQARAAGASGVIGVRTEHSAHHAESGGQHVLVVATGTAIRSGRGQRQGLSVLPVRHLGDGPGEHG